MSLLSKSVLLFAFFSTAAYAQSPVTLSFPGTAFKASVSWLQGPQVEAMSSTNVVDSTTESILALQWIAGGDPGQFQVNVSMSMDGQPMNAQCTMLPDTHPGRYHSSGLFFEMTGAWSICVVLHPNGPDHVSACTSVQLP